MKVRPARAIFLFLVRPGQFRELTEGDSKDQVFPMRRTFFVSLTIVVAALGVGIVTGLVASSQIGELSEEGKRAIRLLGIGAILWAILARQGWSIQTWRGSTLLEKVNRWIFRGLYTLGAFLLALAETWG